jgi:multidrug efflux pump subunit AcrB
VVFLFLNSWRSTVITGLALPVSVLASFIAVWVLGFKLETMSLLGLSLAIGILIDDAIVVRENIVRHVEMGKDHYTASREGTDEIGLAVAATTFSILAVFVPIGFMSPSRSIRCCRPIGLIRTGWSTRSGGSRVSSIASIIGSIGRRRTIRRSLPGRSITAQP